VPRFGRELRELGILSDEADEQLRSEIKAEVNEASRRAEARPDPDPNTALRSVYAEERS
jgi:TPP-dependent pyruvate/acetoin dehydrogenase alpha subunit